MVALGNGWVSRVDPDGSYSEAAIARFQELMPGDFVILKFPELPAGAACAPMGKIKPAKSSTAAERASKGPKTL